MKTRYEFIRFEEVEKKPKTSVYHCLRNSSGDVLGEVKWYGPWRQYCFYPAFSTVFNSGCLDGIVDFLRQLKKL